MQAYYAWDYLAGHEKLTTDVLLKAHKIMMLNHNLQAAEKGYFRHVNVMVGRRLCPAPELVPLMINDWLRKYDSVGQSRIKEAHVEFEKIHPFVDGNGRVGRLIMNWQRINADLPILIIRAAERQDYYKWFNEKEANVVQKRTA